VGHRADFGLIHVTLPTPAASFACSQYRPWVENRRSLFIFSKKISEKSLLILLDHDKHPYDSIRESKVFPATLCQMGPILVGKA
jgi:hypothetical protein